MDWLFPIEIYLYMMLYLMVVYMGSVLVAATIFKIQVLEVDIFKGPIKKKYVIDGITVNRKLFPIGSTVKFLGKDDFSEMELKRMRRPGYKTWDEASWLQRAIICFAGCITLAFIALIILGKDDAYLHVEKGLMHIVSGGLNPCTVGRQYIISFFGLYEISILSAFAVLATKQVAFNFLPIAGTPMYSTLARPINDYFGESFPLSVMKFIGGGLAYAFLLIMMGWILALGVYFFPSVGETVCIFR